MCESRSRPSPGPRPAGDLADPARARRARNLRRAGLVLLLVLVVAAVTGLLGPGERTVSTTADGVSLQVTHPTLTRPGQEVDLAITLDPGVVDADNGTVAVHLPLDLFEELGIEKVSPQAREQVVAGDRIILVLDARPGRTRVLLTGANSASSPPSTSCCWS